MVTSPDRDAVVARTACLRRLVSECRAEGVRRLTLELSDGDLDADERTLYSLLGPAPSRRPELRYEHLRRGAEPALWAADAVAWAASRGYDMARRLAPLEIRHHRSAPR